MRAVDVLPLVPVRWMTGYAFCGSPSKRQSALMRSRVGSSLVSGHRPSRDCSTSAYVGFIAFSIAATIDRLDGRSGVLIAVSPLEPYAMMFPTPARSERPA